MQGGDGSRLAYGMLSAFAQQMSKLCLDSLGNEGSSEPGCSGDDQANLVALETNQNQRFPPLISGPGNCRTNTAPLGFSSLLLDSTGLA